MRLMMIGLCAVLGLQACERRGGQPPRPKMAEVWVAVPVMLPGMPPDHSSNQISYGVREYLLLPQ